jgi:D-alanyl-D-alanine carboxypeptidase
MNRQEARSRVESRVQSAVEDSAEFHSAYLLVHSDSRDIHWKLAAGQTAGIEADPEQPFYAASIDESFTSTIVATLAEEGRLIVITATIFTEGVERRRLGGSLRRYGSPRR